MWPNQLYCVHQCSMNLIIAIILSTNLISARFSLPSGQVFSFHPLFLFTLCFAVVFSHPIFSARDATSFNPRLFFICYISQVAFCWCLLFYFKSPTLSKERCAVSSPLLIHAAASPLHWLGFCCCYSFSWLFGVAQLFPLSVQFFLSIFIDRCLLLWFPVFPLPSLFTCTNIFLHLRQHISNY